MPNATEPLVSIITLNWNNTEPTLKFLESTKNLCYRNYEILVCDMHSDIDPTAVLSNGNFPNTRILRSHKNLGWAAGNNWGIRQAKGEYLFIVNNDTEVTPHLINLLLEPFFDTQYQGENCIGITSPKIKFFYNPTIIQYAGFTPVNPVTGRNAAIGNKVEDKGQFDKNYFTCSAHGCAMMIKREVIEKVGMFPEKFFMYYEELDFSTRAIKNGYKILFTGKAEIYHKESMSIGKKNSLKTYFLTRNRILYMRRNSSKWQYAGFVVFFTFLSIPKTIINLISERKFQHLKSFFKAITWNLRESKYSIQ